ncbi:methylated-DNA--[protein]-cysteine S-methyltransferase [Halomonas sp. CH40]
MKTLYTAYFTAPAPFGVIRLEGHDEGITSIYFDQEGSALNAVESHPLLERCWEQLEAFFKGQRQAFDIPLAAEGTPFQQQVWAALREIPFGETASYGAIASALGKPTASRAVGMANGRNPLPIIVPCHRVIGANGQLTGYSGGLACKRWLLEHEQAHKDAHQAPLT